MLDLDDVRVFVRIAEHRSVTGAAVSLRIHKSLAARRLARLEGALGCVLITRTSRKLALTLDGETFLTHARTLLSAEAEALAAVTQTADRVEGLVRISASITLGTRFVAPHLAELTRRYPKLRIDLNLSSARLDLVAGETDIALRLGRLPDSTLVTRTLGRLEFILVAAPDYLAAGARPAAPEHLGACDIIGIATPLGARLPVLVSGERDWVEGSEPAITVNDPTAAAAICRSGGGVACLPTFVAAPFLKDGSLVRVLPDWAPAPLSLCALTAASPRSARVSAVVDHLVTRVSGDLAGMDRAA